MIKYWLVCLLMITFGLLNGQTNQGMRITDIIVEGNSRISNDVIKMSSGLRKGSMVYGEDIQNAIKKLWNLDAFEDIVMEGERIDQQNFIIKVKVIEYPILEKVSVIGAKEFGEDELKGKIDLYKGQNLCEYDIKNVINSLEDFYKTKNYNMVEISSEKEILADNKVRLLINISEGEKIYIEKITFHGNYNFENDDLIDTFKKTHEDAWWRYGEYNRDEFLEDLQNLKQFYRNHGYKDFVVVRDSVYINDEKSGIHIDVEVSEGMKYYFGNISFQGNTIFNNEDLLINREFEKGDVYSEEKFQKYIYNYLSTRYMDKGYLNSQIEPREVFKEDTVSYIIKFNEGTISKIRYINIVGNSKTNDKVIRREFAIYPGDIFNKTRLIRSQRNLMMLNYFKTAMPDIDKRVSDEEIDLTFKVEEKSTAEITTAISYAQSDGFVGSLGFNFNNFSFSNPFGQGDGQRLKTEVQFGRRYYKYLIGIEEPWLWDTPTLIGLTADYQKKDESYSDTYITGGTLKLGRRFRWSDNYIQGIWYYTLKEIKYKDVKSNIPDYYELYENKSIVSSSLTQYIIRDDRDNYNFPTVGSKVNFMIKIAGGLLQGDEAFHKYKLDVKWYQPLASDHLVLFSNITYGIMSGLTSSSYIGPGEYFYMGGGGLSGSEPLRGYDENSVGPWEKGRFIGGKNMFKSTIELRLKLTSDPMLIYVLAFLDAGNLWSNFKNANLVDLRKSGGVGIRVNVPMVGMMGFDMGYGFDHYDRFGKIRDWRKEFRTYFRIGHDL